MNHSGHLAYIDEGFADLAPGPLNKQEEHLSEKLDVMGAHPDGALLDASLIGLLERVPSAPEAASASGAALPFEGH